MMPITFGVAKAATKTDDEANRIAVKSTTFMFYKCAV
jgi:hypothetical protein